MFPNDPEGESKQKGPFETVDLSQLKRPEDKEKLLNEAKMGGENARAFMEALDRTVKNDPDALKSDPLLAQFIKEFREQTKKTLDVRDARGSDTKRSGGTPKQAESEATNEGLSGDIPSLFDKHGDDKN